MVDLLTEKIAKNPSDPELYFSRSKAHMAEQKYTAATQDIDSALVRDSLNTDYLLHRGNIYFLKNVTRQSRKDWDKCRKIDPSHIECRMKLAELYYTVGDYGHALEVVDEVLDIETNRPEALLLKGTTYRDMGKSEEAHQYLQRAIDERPEYLRALELQANLYAQEGNGLAVAYYQRALAITPNDANLYHGLAVFYKDRREFERAIQTYRQCIALNPQHKESYYAIGYVYLELQEVEKARDSFRQAIDISTDYPQAYFALAYCYELLGELANAEANYRAALSIRPDYAAASEGVRRISVLRNQQGE